MIFQVCFEEISLLETDIRRGRRKKVRSRVILSLSLSEHLLTDFSPPRGRSLPPTLPEKNGRKRATPFRPLPPSIREIGEEKKEGRSESFVTFPPQSSAPDTGII